MRKQQVATVPITTEMVADSMSIYKDVIQRAYDGMNIMWRRQVTPWEFADRNPFPCIDPTPRYSRLLNWHGRQVRRWREGRRRVRMAYRVLRYEDYDEWT